jgi:serine/threonine-protein kinase
MWDEIGDAAIVDSPIANLGIAHGWAGFLYTTLLWSVVTDEEPHPDVDRRLAELARLAEPAGRGVAWAWSLGPSHSTMPGWCNGSAGHVALWTLAHRVLGRTDCLDIPVRAAWDVWDAPDMAGRICCGLAGRAYALLDVARATGDAAWIRRARVLGERAANGHFEPDRQMGLYKGRFGLAVLAADLDRPETATQPLFGLEPR